MAREQGERWDCEACGEELIGALTINGKVAPVELRTHDMGNVWLGRKTGEDGKLSLTICATLGGPLLEKAREVGIALHHNHFTTCTDAKRFERGS